MKKINYFGKEYEVSDEVIYVATDSNGQVWGYSVKPMDGYTSFTFVEPSYLESLGESSKAITDWKNSLKQVKDIIVKENELKVGDKVESLGNYCGFKKGQVVELYKLGNDEMHLFKGPNDVFSLCDGAQGAYLDRGSYKLITPIADKKSYGAHGVLEAAGENKSHPHADLMLKYAMIAQYDDKPWESFECDMGDGKIWCDMITTGFQRDFNYRLKPQDPKIQIGQVWVSKEGVDVVINVQSNKDTIVFVFTVGGMTHRDSCSYSDFLQNFKLKE